MTAITKSEGINPFGSLEAFGESQRVAQLLAASSIVPDTFRGNIPNCVIALNLAYRLRADVFAVMRNMYIIGGKPAFEAKFHIACINLSGRFTTLKYEYFGEPGTDSYGCRARATDRETGEDCVGPDITIGMARREGWFDRKGSKWQTIPQLMLQYRAATWWSNGYTPEATMGIMTADEAYDALPPPGDRQPVQVAGKAEVVTLEDAPAAKVLSITEKIRAEAALINNSEAAAAPPAPEPVAPAESAEAPPEPAESGAKAPAEPVKKTIRERVMDLADQLWGTSSLSQLSKFCKSHNYGSYHNLTNEQLEIIHGLLKSQIK